MRSSTLEAREAQASFYRTPKDPLYGETLQQQMVCSIVKMATYEIHRAITVDFAKLATGTMPAEKIPACYMND